jgi:hypothetical protein
LPVLDILPVGGARALSNRKEVPRMGVAETETKSTPVVMERSGKEEGKIKLRVI